MLDLEGSAVNSVETETHTHTVVTIRAKMPRYSAELSERCFDLHQACSTGQLVKVANLIKIDPKLCLVKDKCGMIPLHTATMKGKLDVMKELLNACSESLRQVNARSETPLHTAVLFNQVKALQLLVDWLKRTSNIHLLNSRDWRGNTVLHLATSRKQLRTIEFLLGHDRTIRAVMDINAMNAGGFTALDILDVLPQGKMDTEICKILRAAGALNAKEVTKEHQNSNHEVVIDCGGCYQPSYLNTTKPVCSAVLLIATLFATITFRAALCPPGGIWDDGKTYKTDLINGLQLEKQNSTLTRCFIFFNSMGFFTSVAMILFLMHDFPWKPWLFVSVSSLVGSYVCSIIEISPSEAMALVALGSPFVLLATAPRLRRMVLKCVL